MGTAALESMQKFVLWNIDHKFNQFIFYGI
jgi:hypothetical protein